MIHRRSHQLGAAFAAMLLAASLGARSAAAEEAAAPATAEPAATDSTEEGPNTGALSITLDDSFTTAYMFRGIAVQRDGLIWQPSVEVGLNLFESEEGLVRSVDLGMGIWASYQSKDAYSAGDDGLFEVDYYPSLSATWQGGVTTGITYYAYTAGNGSWRTVEEVDVDLAWDDSDLLGAWALNPTATLAFETKNTSFGTGKGASLQLGIEPGTEVTLPIEGAEQYPLSLTFPATLGLSLDSYYNDGTRDEAFGYFAAGLHASVPLAFLPKRYGSWSVTNGFDLYVLNDALEAANRNDAVYPVWTSSVTLEY